LTVLTLSNSQIAGSLQGLTTLHPNTIDLSCNPAALLNEITALDNAIDGGDGMASGVVVWDICPLG